MIRAGDFEFVGMGAIERKKSDRRTTINTTVTKTYFHSCCCMIASASSLKDDCIRDYNGTGFEGPPEAQQPGRPVCRWDRPASVENWTQVTD